MKEKVRARLVELSRKAEELYVAKVNHENEIDRINVELAQVVGAIQELGSLVDGVNDELEGTAENNAEATGDRS